jgi:poly(A) polymerase
MIDDPWTRYREDPVRMLRAARFAAKLDFEIAPDTAAPMRELGVLLLDVPSARLFDETLKLFQTGHAAKSFDRLVEQDLLRYLFPSTAAMLAGPERDAVERFVRLGLENTDRRIAEDQSVTPMFLYAVLLWPAIERLAARVQAERGCGDFEAMQEAMARIVAEQVARTALPKRFSIPMKEMLMLQRRFAQRTGGRALKLLDHKRFRAAYDFLVLRSRAGEVDQELAAWWTEAQAAGPQERAAAAEPVPGRRRRRRSRRRRGAPRAST